MIEYRPFLNTDPPRIVEIWRAEVPRRELLGSVSHNLLERYVYCKPYFDREGLLLAVNGKDPLGFVHAGFASRPDRSTLDLARGVISLLLVSPQEKRSEIAAQLLQHAEDYLIRRGAQSILVGGSPGADPFYVGLVGGSEVSGISVSDEWTSQLCADHGYHRGPRRLVLQRSLVGFRPQVDRQLMQIRRSFNIEAHLDPPARDWWEACTYGEANRSQFLLTNRQGQCVGKILFWDIEPLGDSWGIQASGILAFEIADENEWQPRASFLLGESLRQLQSHGVMLVEVHCDESDEVMNNFYRSFEFEQVDEMVAWEKEVTS